MILIMLDHAQCFKRKKYICYKIRISIIQFEIKKWNKMNDIVGRRKISWDDYFFQATL